MSLIRCNECGKEYSKLAPSCPNCGCPTSRQDNSAWFPIEEHQVTTTNHTEHSNYTDSSPLPQNSPFNSTKRTFLFVLCLFLGEFGLHRFFVGKTKSGFVYLFTLGGFCIGWLVDLYLIYTGKFTDKYGNYI